jgi:hypothetical protein
MSINKIKTFWSFYKNYKNRDYKQLLDQYEGLKHHWELQRQEWELTKQEQEKKWKLEYEILEKSRSSLYSEIRSMQRQLRMGEERYENYKKYLEKDLEEVARKKCFANFFRAFFF